MSGFATPRGVTVIAAPSRTMRCTECGDLVETFEVPFGFLGDPAEYVCGECAVRLQDATA